jgi:hypothetical protein
VAGSETLSAILLEDMRFVCIVELSFQCNRHRCFLLAQHNPDPL